MGKTQKIKRLRFTFSCLGTALLRISAKLKQPCFIGMECKTEARKAIFKGLKQRICVLFILETQHGIICIANDNNVPFSISPPPMVDP